MSPLTGGTSYNARSNTAKSNRPTMVPFAAAEGVKANT
jgi:hypothetical protein